MAGLTARAARIGFGQGFDVGDRIASRKLRERSQRFSESLSLRAEGRAERSLALQEQRLALQRQEAANETFSVPQLNSFNQLLVQHMEAAPSIEIGEGSKSRFVNSEDTDRTISDFKGLIKFDLLGTNKRDQVERLIGSLRSGGLPPVFDTKGAIEFQGRRFGQQRQATFGDVATQVADDVLSTQPAFQETDIDDVTQFSDEDLQGIIDKGTAFPSQRTVTPPNAREDQAFRGGSFR